MNEDAETFRPTGCVKRKGRSRLRGHCLCDRLPARNCPRSAASSARGLDNSRFGRAHHSDHKRSTISLMRLAYAIPNGKSSLRDGYPGTVAVGGASGVIRVCRSDLHRATYVD